MKTFKKAPIAVAIASLLLSGAALATGNSGTTDPDPQTGFEASSSINSEATNKKYVSIDHDSEFDSNIRVYGKAYISGKGYAGATVDAKQLNEGNTTVNINTENDAEIEGSAFNGAKGNIGANVAGGDNNQQANDAALAVSDAHKVFARGSNFSFQSSAENTAINIGTENNAGIEGSAFNGALGNIQVNAAAGVGNSQQNAFSAGVANGGSAEATSVGIQQSYANVSLNGLGDVSANGGVFALDLDNTTNNASIAGSAFAGAKGNIGVNVTSGSSNMQRNSLTIAASK